MVCLHYLMSSAPTPKPVAFLLSRLVAPVLLRQLLLWLRNPDKAAAGGTGRGWMWASLFGITGFGLTLVHHQLFWYGERWHVPWQTSAHPSTVQARLSKGRHLRPPRDHWQRRRPQADRCDVCHKVPWGEASGGGGMASRQ